MTSLSLETHSPALFIAHTICALVGVGMTTYTSFEAKGEIRKQTIQLTIKLSTTILKFYGLASEYRILLLRIMCMAWDQYQKLKRRYKGRGQPLPVNI